MTLADIPSLTKLTASQFNVVTRLIRGNPDSASHQAARLVLVDGAKPSTAAHLMTLDAMLLIAVSQQASGEPLETICVDRVSIHEPPPTRPTQRRSKADRKRNKADRWR